MGDHARRSAPPRADAVFDTRSSATAELLDDPCFVRIGDLTGDGHSHQRRIGNRVEALFKPIVHLSCTLHMAQPPAARERRVLYTGFWLPDRSGHAPLARQKLRAVREKSPVTVSQEPSRVGRA